MESTILLHNRARVHVALGDFDNAIEDYTTLLRHEPGNSEAHLDRGIIHQRAGRYHAALKDYDCAIALSLRDDATARYNRGRIFESQKRWQAAIDDYSRALEFGNGDLQLIRRHRDACYHEIQKTGV